jgi:molybdate transport system substrate-binding protein
VPVGTYTLKVLGRLGPAGNKILARVRSREPSVDGIVAKLATGAVDAGFLYATDVRAARGRLRAIELSSAAQPTVVYEAAVVRGARHAARGRKFIAGLLTGAGRSALLRAGFDPPPTG